MRFSDKIDLLMPAIRAVQRAVPFVEKTAQADLGATRKEKYAPHDEVWDAIRGHCDAAGLTVTQHGRLGAGGVQLLVTLVAHDSGQWVESEVRVESAKAGFRDAGAAWSYWRRMALLAAFGIVGRGEDPEADKALYGQQANPPQRQTPRARPAHAPEDAAKRVEDALAELAKATTAARVDEIGKSLKDADGASIVPKDMRDRVRAAFSDASARIRAGTVPA